MAAPARPSSTLIPTHPKYTVRSPVWPDDQQPRNEEAHVMSATGPASFADTTEGQGAAKMPEQQEAKQLEREARKQARKEARKQERREVRKQERQKAQTEEREHAER